MARFEGKAVAVTGGARNIGRAIGEAFAREGAAVALLDRDGAAAEATATEIAGATGATVVGIACDVSREDAVAGAIGAVLDRLGRLDVAVNNAGICTLALATELEEADWDRVLAVNLKGAWLVAKHGAPAMTRGGAIVNLASQAAQRAQKFTAHYSASKMGIIGLTRALSVELAPDIRVNAVSPGTVVNDLIDQEVAWRIARGENRDREDVMKQWMDRIPLGRFQEAADIARGVVFLASDDAREITGETLNISGGAVMV
ncbi:MAG: SDR family oxidoreductase [Azospirillaceae bacterium]